MIKHSKKFASPPHLELGSFYVLGLHYVSFQRLRLILLVEYFIILGL